LAYQALYNYLILLIKLFSAITLVAYLKY